MLKDDHKTIEKLFKRFEQAGDRAFVEKRTVVDRIIECFRHGFDFFHDFVAFNSDLTPQATLFNRLKIGFFDFRALLQFDFFWCLRNSLTG